MFCPECRAEYRAGFKTCSDCHVDLVDELPAASAVAVTASDANLQQVWNGASQEDCVMYCTELREAQIPYQVIQHHQQVVKRVEDSYRIGVAPEFFERAKKIIEVGLDDSTDPEMNPDAEPAAQDDKSPTDVDDEHLDWKDEAPTDAVVEVASQPSRDAADLMVIALRENDIESRITVLPDGARKIFVTPDDESRAREIIREVESGDPPE
jgi:hypothetical protein